MSLRLKAPQIVRGISPAQLRTHLAAPSPLPLLLPDLASGDVWPGARSWTLNDGLKRVRDVVEEDREVDVELGPRGRGYLDKGYRRVGMGFGESTTCNRLLQSETVI